MVTPMGAITRAAVPMQLKRINVVEAAAYLGISVSKMNKMRTFGGGPRYFKLDHRVVYDVADLDNWVSERSRNNTSQNHAA